MTNDQSALSELADALIGTDATLTTSIADILGTALQELIEAEVSARIGADQGERTPARSNLRNGRRPNLLSTPAGDVEVGITKLRTGSFFPELLEPRRRIDKALWAAMMMRDWITGTYTRKADDLVKALGVYSGVSKSTVSRTGTARFSVWTGNSENETFWTEFHRDLVDRGLDGVQPVISDAHAGPRAAIRRVLQGSGWQRSSVRLSHGQGILSATRSWSALAA